MQRNPYKYSIELLFKRAWRPFIFIEYKLIFEFEYITLRSEFHLNCVKLVHQQFPLYLLNVCMRISVILVALMIVYCVRIVKSIDLFIKHRKLFPCMPGRNSLAYYMLKFIQNEISCSLLSTTIHVNSTGWSIYH